MSLKAPYSDTNIPHRFIGVQFPLWLTIRLIQTNLFMALSTLDLCIILAYVAATIGIGFWISKKAAGSTRDYFLGGNQIPWYYLGVSNASGMFDISGTMWMVYLLFVYGLKSAWIPWLWPAFNQIFLMIYLSVWLRRSGVMTGAEWITFRFGKGRGAELSHLIVVVFAILNVIGFLAFGFVGIGKFAATFIPHQFSADADMNANIYGLLVTGITTLYVVKGGMFSVVFTELLQFVIMTIASIAVGVIAMNAVSPEMLAQHVPSDWKNLFFGWKLVAIAARRQRQNCGRWLDDVWGVFYDDVVQRLASKRRRTRSELRHAARTFRQNPRGSSQNVGIGQPGLVYSAIYAGGRIDGFGHCLFLQRPASNGRKC